MRLQAHQKLDGSLAHVADLKISWKCGRHRRPSRLLFDVQEWEDCFEIKTSFGAVKASNDWQFPPNKFSKHVVKARFSLCGSRISNEEIPLAISTLGLRQSWAIVDRN